MILCRQNMSDGRGALDFRNVKLTRLGLMCHNLGSLAVVLGGPKAIPTEASWFSLSCFWASDSLCLSDTISRSTAHVPCSSVYRGDSY